jgi:hypothetical protein
VDRKTGTTLSRHELAFDDAHLGPDGLVGASGSLAWLKKKGWRTAVRSVPLDKGYVMRWRLDGRLTDTVPLSLPRVDAFASAHGVALVGSPKGVTWLPGTLNERQG